MKSNGTTAATFSLITNTVTACVCALPQCVPVGGVFSWCASQKLSRNKF